MGSMDGRTIIVTGGARGMGAATARRLAAEGGTVVIGDVLADEASALASEIEQSGGHAVSASLDVTSETDWERVTAVAGELGGADALVNNAGISQRVGILETERSHWDQVLAINLTGCMLGIRAVAPGMCDRGRGSIVNISSIAGLVAYSSAHPPQTCPTPVQPTGCAANNARMKYGICSAETSRPRQNARNSSLASTRTPLMLPPPSDSQRSTSARTDVQTPG